MNTIYNSELQINNTMFYFTIKDLLQGLIEENIDKRVLWSKGNYKLINYKLSWSTVVS